MHSWRVLILPYMGEEEQQLYSRYNLNEPWNSPENHKLAALRPRFMFAQAIRPQHHRRMQVTWRLWDVIQYGPVQKR